MVNGNRYPSGPRRGDACQSRFCENTLGETAEEWEGVDGQSPMHFCSLKCLRSEATIILAESSTASHYN